MQKSQKEEEEKDNTPDGERSNSMQEEGREVSATLSSHGEGFSAPTERISLRRDEMITRPRRLMLRRRSSLEELPTAAAMGAAAASTNPRVGLGLRRLWSSSDKDSEDVNGLKKIWPKARDVIKSLAAASSNNGEIVSQSLCLVIDFYKSFCYR